MYERFKEFCGANGGWGHNGKFYGFLKSVVTEESIKQLYVKNWFVDNESMKAYVFTENAMYKIWWENHRFKYSYRKLVDIRSLSFETDMMNSSILEIHFSDGETVGFNNAEDSNEHWRQEYLSVIKEISNYLLTKAP